mmetsp:Transcript_36489/g.66875  ORF Transcript_36489/g.66875 Transcript_36489/m.66875 type:complete len:486 (+) Transcript_36489:102-1559(+)
MGCCEATQGKKTEVETLDVFRAGGGKDALLKEEDKYPPSQEPEATYTNGDPSRSPASPTRSSLRGQDPTRRRDFTGSFGVGSVSFAPQDMTRSTRLEAVAEAEPDGHEPPNRSTTHLSTATSTWSSIGGTSQGHTVPQLLATRPPEEQARVISDTDSKPSLRRALSTVAAGHGGMSIVKDFDGEVDMSGIPSYINKKYDKGEVQAYKALKDTNDPLLEFTPQYFGEVAAEGDERYIRLSNLLKPFMRAPHVMDCKLGIRSFAEEEVRKTELRADLYEKLVLLDPTAPTEEEQAKQACTKYRWMSYNDKFTGLDTLGFRIDGIANPNVQHRLPKRDLKILRTVPNCANCIAKHFLPTPTPQVDEANLTPEEERIWQQKCSKLQSEAASQIVAGLKRLKAAMLRSPFAQTHSFVGSSLLFIVDSGEAHVAVHLIDFAKTTPTPAGVTIDHQTPWQPGNHEDGLFIGIDNMIACWEMVLDIASGLDSC